MKQIIKAAPWVLTTVIGYLCLATHGVPVADVMVYSFYLIVAVLGPGMLLLWALNIYRQNLIEDIGFGAVVGLCLELIAWYIFSLIGIQEYLRWWPFSVYLLFLLEPTLRRSAIRKREINSIFLPWWWGTGICLVISLSFLAFAANSFQKYPLPPANSEIYLDLWWHLSLNHELARTASPQLPQVAGEALRYHWFANAHMASAHLITGISEPLILFRLWIFPLIAITAMVIAGLARQVTGAHWAGPVAAWLVLGTFNGGDIWRFYHTLASSPMIFLSPSMTYSSPLLIVAVSLWIDLVRGINNNKRSIIIFLVTAAASVAKPTAMPLLLAGLGLTSIFILVREHRVPRRIIAGGGVLAFLTFWSFYVGAGNGGTKIIFIDLIRSAKFYSMITGDANHYASSDGWVRESLRDLHAYLAASLVLIWFFFSQSARIIGLCCLFFSRTRRDEGVWFLSGIVLAGYGLFLTVAHPGLGQLYFAISVIPFGIVLSVYLAEAASRGIQKRYALLGIGAVVGLVAGMIGRLIISTAPTSTSLREWYIAIGTPVLAFLTILSIVLLIVKMVVRNWRFSQGAFLAMFVSAFLSLPLIEATNLHGKSVEAFINSPTAFKARPNAVEFVSKGEQEAAIWLNKNSAPEDIVATNLHCRPPKNKAGCSAAAFWLSGLSGRRVLLEGWSYAPIVTRKGNAKSTHSTHYSKQPSPWPDRQRLSDSAIKSPTTETVESLYNEYSVKWLFAVERAGPVSKKLGNFSVLKFRNDEVSIYKLEEHF